MNRPFPSWLKPLFQSEAKCEAIDMIFCSHENKTRFHNKGLEKQAVIKLGGQGYINVDLHVTTTLRCSQINFRKFTMISGHSLMNAFEVI